MAYRPYKHRRINGRMVDVHVIVWMDEHKSEVPDGCCIHHRDGNVWNNDPKNLVCMSISQHRSYHSKRQKRNKNGRFTK